MAGSLCYNELKTGKGDFMKLEWKKTEQELYSPKNQPQIITVPQQKFIMIKGEGNPNLQDFSERVGVLYSVAWPVKMQFKAFYNDHPEQRPNFDYSEYAIFPLEGLWTSLDASDPTNKEQFRYTIMIRQPDFITDEMFLAGIHTAERKKPHAILNEVTFGTLEEGLSVQMLHKGSFDDEPASFSKMDRFTEEKGFRRLNEFHREIYLGDPRKGLPEKRRTILRYQISPAV